MRVDTRLIKYIRADKAGGLNACYNLLSKTRKKYVRYLVARYGYPVRIAVQRAYIFGFDAWPYDYRAGHIEHETMAREYFGKW